MIICSKIIYDTITQCSKYMIKIILRSNSKEVLFFNVGRNERHPWEGLNESDILDSLNLDVGRNDWPPHLYGLSPACALRCLMKFILSVKALSHCLH